MVERHIALLHARIKPGGLKLGNAERSGEETPKILRRKAVSGRRARGTRRLTPFLNALEERRLLSGDAWTQRGGDAGHAAFVDVGVAPGAIAEAWNQPLTYSAEGDWAQHGNRGVAIDATHVYRTDLDGYWASGDYHIIAYDLQTGAVDWNRTIVGNGPVSHTSAPIATMPAASADSNM